MLTTDLPSRKENTQWVLNSDPGQRVFCAFFTLVLRNFTLFYLPAVRVFYSDPPLHFFTAFLTRFLRVFNAFFSFPGLPSWCSGTPRARCGPRSSLLMESLGQWLMQRRLSKMIEDYHAPSKSDFLISIFFWIFFATPDRAQREQSIGGLKKIVRARVRSAWRVEV